MDMAHWVYALYSQIHDRLYVGESSDPQDRYRSHNELATKGWTIHFRPWIVLYLEECADRSVALKREKRLKSGSGREFLRSLIVPVTLALRSDPDIWRACVSKTSRND